MPEVSSRALSEPKITKPKHNGVNVLLVLYSFGFLFVLPSLYIYDLHTR